MAIAALTVAELLVGVELGAGSRRRARRRFLAGVLELLPVEPYDIDVALRHAPLIVHARRTGKPRSAHDLIVAATAAARGRIVVTADAAGFDDLPGVSVRAPA